MKPLLSGRHSATPVVDSIAPTVRSLLGRELPFRLRGWDGSETGPADSPVTVVIHSPLALRYLLWAPGELGLARAHVAGELDIEGDIFKLLNARDLLVDEVSEPYELRFNPKSLGALAKSAFNVGAIGPPPPRPIEEAKPRGLRHSIGRDAASVSHHYDVGNDFYRIVLGPSWTYSCGYWPTGDMTLEQAQASKYELVSRKLGLREGMRLLDVGCGWGGMVIHAALHHGVRAVGVTISKEQQQKARERVEELGLGDRVEIRLQDYREIHDGPFDAISSIGMFEHVGEERMKEYLSDLRDLLRPGGRLLNHAISRPDPSRRSSIRPRSFVGRYVFPDGALVEVGRVVSTMQGLGLEVRDLQSLREHYARTLRAWVANLESQWDEAQRLAGPGRARVWRLYMAGSALGFEDNRISVHQVLAVRTPPDGKSDVEPNRSLLDVPQPVDLGLPSGS
ncbi:MAG TPA: cyclopropane-fatty-acyl-phospholipid synthase family protein [Acidimicrobiales bacterium]|jgi:cyclopropane-fatty-acyl-phospholipid synthase|nr:cyclopropane-fatty-acyl-phospholipid synthase family protein [Acidimicrobiales bacterium]